MGRKPAKRPSFFKVLSRTDFTRFLRLPHVFMQRYGSNLPKRVKLRIESGKTWDVKVKLMEEDGLFCFSKGWNVFAKDVGLKFGQFLVFSLNDTMNGFSSFDVCVYETSGLKKEFPNEQKQETPLYYQFVLKQYHKSRFSLRRTFARAAGLLEKRRVEVVGEHRKQWVALYHNRLKDASLRADMAQGWHDFRTANRLVYGKTYSIEFKPNKNLIKIKEVID